MKRLGLCAAKHLSSVADKSVVAEQNSYSSSGCSYSEQAFETLSCCNKHELFVLCAIENCPDHNLTLSDWNPGQNPKKAVVVRNGQLFRLTASATLHSLTIQSGGKV